MYIYYIILSGLFFYVENSFQSPKSVDNFTLINATDNSNFSLSSLKDSPAIVVIFTSNSCPYDKLYHRRIEKLLDDYRKRGVRFVFINSNDPLRSPEDSPRQMADKVKELRWQVPYLIDEDQKVAARFGARKNPEAYVLKYRTNDFQILYSGSIDDNPQVASDVSQPYLRMALDAVLAGKPVLIEQTHTTGCMIK